MLSEDTKIIEFNQNCKSDKDSFIIYADLESLIEKINECKNNPEKSSTTKVSEHILSGFSVSTISSFKAIGEDCMKKIRESLREHRIKIINFKKKKIWLLTNEQQKSHENAKICYICKEKFEDKYTKDKNYCKVRDHCPYTGKYRGVAQSKCIVYLKKFL